MVREKVKEAALKFLNDIKKRHSKVKNISYSSLQPQEYIKSEIFSNEELETLFALRSKMTRLKGHFTGPHPNKDDILCSHGCDAVETIEHLLSCKYLVEQMSDSSVLAEAEYRDVFGSVEQQKQIANIYIELLKIKEDISKK